MPGLDKIISRLQDECNAECDKIKLEAEANAADTVKNAEKNAEIILAAAMSDAKEQAKGLIERAQSSAALDARQQMLKAKVEVIDGVLAEAEKKLGSLDNDAYFTVLLQLAEKNRQKGEGIMKLSADDQKRLPLDFAKKLGGYIITVSQTPADIQNGFILIYGDIEINCTFKALFGAAREELKAKAGEILFG